ncbi:hypothetical protein [Ferrimonas balearica]|uniref:hypothetical protein n=1 Tax=Ferrimonas balearica TaxID=44012 RepID=UPI001F3C4811|nr:hypothetical protein [Ferrimonas balearica]MBY6093966.1 hypothetical protein [Ferrimonas balearica]
MLSINFLLTYGIIGTLLMGFLYVVYKEWRLCRDTVLRLSSLQPLLNRLRKGEYDEFTSSEQERDWVEEHLILVLQDEQLKPVKIGNRYLVNSVLATLIPSYNLSHYKLIPALLTSIGITGTFLGVTMGLAGLDLTGGSDSLMASAYQLLEGMKTAFYTSVAGLSLSAIFMMLMKRTAIRVHRAETELMTQLRDTLVYANPVNSLQKMAASSQDEVVQAQLKSAQVMEGLGKEFRSISNDFKASMGSFNSEKISESLNAAVSETMKTEMVPVFDGIRTELGQLREIKEQSQKELVTLLVGELQEKLIAPVTQQLEKTASAVDDSNQLTKQLNQNVAEVLTQMAGTVQTIDSFQKETMTKLQEFAQALKGILQSFKDDTQGAMSTISKEIESMLQHSIDGMTAQRTAFDESTGRAATAFEGIQSSMEKALDDRSKSEMELFSSLEARLKALLQHGTDSMEGQRKAFDESTDRAATAFEGIQSSMENALDERKKSEMELFNGLQDRLKGLLGNMESSFGKMLDDTQQSFDKQTGVLEQVGIDASTLMESARVELESGLGDIDSKVKAMSSEVQKELETFRVEYQKNLTKYFEDQNNALEQSLGAQRDGLLGVVNEFKTVFEQEYQKRHNLLSELTAQYAQLEKSAQTIERVAKAIGLHEASKMAELQDASSALAKEVGLLKREYANASAKYVEITEGMPKAMNEYFTKANSSIETFFKDFDEAASTIHNRLAQAADYLVEAQIQKQQLEADEAVA